MTCKNPCPDTVPTGHGGNEGPYGDCTLSRRDLSTGTIFDFEGEPSVGYAEGYRAGRTIESSPEVANLVLMFDHLRASALSAGDSQRMIAAIRGDYDE